MEVFVFKTNLTRRRLNTLQRPLSTLVNGARWTVDWEDCDRVLRIESDALHPAAVETYLRAQGVECEELQH